MKEIIEQLKYDTQRIEFNLNAIKKAEIKMVEFIDKPIYYVYSDAIKKWKSEISDHLEMIDIYYVKLKELQNN